MRNENVPAVAVKLPLESATGGLLPDAVVRPELSPREPSRTGDHTVELEEANAK